jgi:CheY-like chemotaxis protein
VEVISQPCGPRKLAKVLSQCVKRVEEIFNKPMIPDRQPQPKGLPHRSRLEDMGAATMLGLPSMTLPRLNTSEERVESSRAREFIRNTGTELPPSTAVAFPNINRDEGNARETQNQTPAASVPHVLCVDDNNINLQLLSMFMKKHKLPYQEAVNGQEALDKYIEHSSGRPNKQPFDFILMDISMPVMDGLEATRRIREFEIEHKVEKKATIIALTGLASAEAQADAEASGVDIYMAKPVKFQALRPLLVSKKPEKKAEEQKLS